MRIWHPSLKTQKTQPVFCPHLNHSPTIKPKSNGADEPAHSMLILNRIKRTTYTKALSFYNDVVTQSGLRSARARVLLVCPGYESTFPMIESISRHFDLCGIIIKNSTKRTAGSLKALLTTQDYPVLDISKQDIKLASQETIDKLHTAIGDNNCIVLDHGGYFALNEKILRALGPDVISGIAEYALNGEQRYISLNINDRPIISVGRLALKRESDHASADSILLAAELYLQNGGVMLFNQDTKVGVIGHGTLGSRITHQLQARHAEKPLVYDTDSGRTTGIPEENIAHRIDELYAKCDVIFCATGNHAIKASDFEKVRDGTIIFTVTSPDDELNLEALLREGIISLQEQHESSQTYIYIVRSTGHKIILPFNGESPNTLIDFGTADPSIHQPCAAHIIAGNRLSQNNVRYSCGVQDLNKEDESLAFDIWQQHYRMPPTESALPFKPPQKNKMEELPCC